MTRLEVYKLCLAKFINDVLETCLDKNCFSCQENEREDRSRIPNIL